jgi:hypothetical protein
VDIPFVAVLVVGLLIAGGIAYAAYRRHRGSEESLQRFLARDPRLQRTLTPCGLGPDSLADTYEATPRGDRRYGVRYGVAGPLVVPVAGDDVDVECASFQWWHERRRTTSDKNGTRTHYERQTTPVTMLRLPVHVPTRVRLSPESMLGRVGLTHGDHQLESSEFNRRFKVEARDRLLVVQLLDAGLQQRLTEDFQGRSIEVAGDLLVLGGRPEHRDASLTGVVGHLPAMRQDVRRLLDAVPAQFWRAVGPDRRD